VPAKFQINDQVRITLVHPHSDSTELATFQCTGYVSFQVKLW